MASRVGMCASASMVGAQLLRVRENWPTEVWGRTGRVQLASAFIGSLITGKWVGMSEPEACATGMWVHGANPNNATGQGYWDEEVLEIVAGSREDGRRVRGWLGDVDVSGGSRRVGNVSRYLVERYGFDQGASFFFLPIRYLTRPQTRSFPHLHRIIFQRTFLFARHQTTLFSHSDPWITCSRRPNIIFLHASTIFSRTPSKNRGQNQDTSPFSPAGPR